MPTQEPKWQIKDNPELLKILEEAQKKLYPDESLEEDKDGTEVQG